MRKLVLFIVALSAVALLAAPVLAGIENTAHDPSGAYGGFDGLAVGGKCSACHIPHQASVATGASRLWPVPPNTDATMVGAVAPLCGYCHHSAGGAGLTDAYPVGDGLVYGTYSHGRYMSPTAGGRTSADPGGALIDNKLPYVSGASDRDIECTSCHNVHNNDDAPFLRADINNLCSACHGSRAWVNNGTALEGDTAVDRAIAGTWGYNIAQSTNNPGSHPVGADMTEANADSKSPITIPAIAQVAFQTSATNWDLGGHLSNGATGGVVCVSCHAVHGVEEDDLGTVGLEDQSPNSNFLVVSQSAMTLNNRSVANGDNERNYLCEACHVGNDVKGQPAEVQYLTWDTTTGGYILGKIPNPGGTSYGHPIDDMNSSSGTAWVATFPANWPDGQTDGTATTDHIWTDRVDPVPICESCHAAHPYANRTRDDLTWASIANTGDSEYILRGTQSGVCTACHKATDAGGNSEHHPVGVTFNGDPVLYLTNVTTSSAQQVSCGTCHSGGVGDSGSVHNWYAEADNNFGLDPSWKPYDNARSSSVDNQMSLTCMECHLNLTTDNGKSPTNNDGITGQSAYGLLGSGTHFIGAFSTTSSFINTTLNSDLAWPWGDWSAQGGTSVGFARFGTTSNANERILVCESCHELEPEKNVGNQLLLAPYNEGMTGTNRSELCEGCHMPPGTHPQTGDTVDRTGTSLDTATRATSTLRAWLKLPTAGTLTDSNPTMTEDGDILNCDSCHQPHDAPFSSRTYILDVAGSNVVAGSVEETGAYLDAAYADSLQPRRAVHGGSPAKANFDVKNFCAVCHPYN